MEKWLVYAVLIISMCAVQAQQTMTILKGGPLTFSAGPNEPKYAVNYVDEGNTEMEGEETSLQKVVMTDKAGKKFLCMLPEVKEDESEGHSYPYARRSEINGSTEGGEGGPHRQQSPGEVLKGHRNVCFYLIDGWWTYEFCYRKHVRQFHKEGDKVVADFSLGTFDSDATAALSDGSEVGFQKEPQSAEAALRYYSQVYTNGTSCDLTDQLRQTEVRFFCSPESQSYLSAILEPATCRYILKFHTPLLCKHPLYRQETRPWSTIHCRPHAEESADGASGQSSMQRTDETRDLVEKT
ncbi:protein OS-9 [Klebsormidium nitens]|uniref:Protein OS-9 n=1 Tax=Klebsormidium nitens TaxID=105231 RepID=A0A1Y1I5S0_KLENI|nr:protein OS-9 [Klebsormidium nitens]|eukprot:GAQ84749.1 protein OS-9 [Klebsormidium nitens]